MQQLQVTTVTVLIMTISMIAQLMMVIMTDITVRKVVTIINYYKRIILIKNLVNRMIHWILT